jgi:hypothetical protein
MILTGPVWSAPYKFNRSRRHKIPKAQYRGDELAGTLSQENEGMPGALTANGDGFEFLQNAVYEAGMVCLAQGRGGTVYLRQPRIL